MATFVTVPLPFSVTGKQAVAMNKFMAEWFNAYEEYSIGDFVTEHTQLTETASEYGKGYEIPLMAWLAPFDLGVSQHVTLRTKPIDMKDARDRPGPAAEVGDVSSWMRVNRRFLNTLRKQFLIQAPSVRRRRNRTCWRKKSGWPNGSG
ncbi:MAG: hypothetical protein M5U09_29455 [Gammaproteobacteria bacterium]|nr:hypothetical protein [Gammaproteobacteria bacterium]